MLISIAQAQLFFLAFTRIMATLIHVPMLGGQSVPAQVRIAFGLLLTAILIPWQPLGPEAEALGLFGFALGIGKELLIGTLAGFAANLTFGALQIAGEAMGLESGFNSGRILNPAMGDAGSAYGQVFIMIAMMYFLVIDGHHLAIMAIERSFLILPINGQLPTDSLETIMRMTAQLITVGVHLSLPVLVALFLADLTLGLVARVAPQIQVFFLGLPLKVAVSLAALGLVFTVIFPALSSLYGQMGERMLILLEK